jgi:hypothetical protein
MSDATAARRALSLSLAEILDGPPPEAAYVLNKGDVGLLRSLDALSAEAASARPDGGSSIAAHVDHLRYGFELLNRWARGEDPGRDADFTKSWSRHYVDEQEWRARRLALARETRAWRAVIDGGADWDHEGWANAVGIVVHLAYHLGAIRQLAPAARGPRAIGVS